MRAPCANPFSVLFPTWPGFLALGLTTFWLWPPWVDAKFLVGLVVAASLCGLRAISDARDMRNNWVETGEESLTISSRLTHPEMVTVSKLEIVRVEWKWGTEWFYNISPTADRACELVFTTQGGKVIVAELLFPHTKARWDALRSLGQSMNRAQWIVGGDEWDPRSAPLGPKGQRWTSIWGMLPPVGGSPGCTNG